MMNKQQQAYMDSLMKHIRSVQEAGEEIGVDQKQLAIHDQSKFTDIEFVPYATHFYDANGVARMPNGKRDNAYNVAWLNHLHLNPHHWQHWIFPDGWEPEGSDIIKGVMAMPENYALEMIADWMGASMAYTGSWDMSAWLVAQMPNIIVHPKTAQYLKEQLRRIGYGMAMDAVDFKSPKAMG